MCRPFTSKNFVLFKNDWRIRAGSVAEIWLFVFIAVCISFTHYSYSVGGPRKLINLLVKSPKIAREEFLREGVNRCEAEGNFRWNDGRIIENAKWLIIGSENSHEMAYWNGSKIVRNDLEGQFLKSVLRTENISWPVVVIRGLCTVNKDSFYYAGNKWHFAKKGEIATGTIKSLDGSAPEITITKPSWEQ